ncbi:MAG: transcription antitermination factor NusB [Bacteroidetes bacterium HGW-Bacteroidetes-16]|jgi:N utilization substance protein B|nr:MAG: transcription antitermination factor NusB [Bacteroidetes bacterium HGW-Bacteroidetes-16]
MLYRRHLRIKVLQALYSWYTGSAEDLGSGEKQLLQSVNKIYELFIWQLSFIIELRRFADVRMEENKQKFYPTDEDLKPRLNFIQNKVLLALEQNLDFKRKDAAFKTNWGSEEGIVRKFFNELKEKDFYNAYLLNENLSLEDDKRFLIKLVDLLLADFDLLKSFYEEKSVHYTDGYDLVNILLIKFIDTVSSDFISGSLLPDIYKSENGSGEEDMQFLKRLYRHVITRDEELAEILKLKTNNWDYERVPMMDIILLKMAIIEFQEMETVPVKVTLNEYIELAKYFSTPNSKTFVNGVLDRLIREFKEEGKIKKIGRGLVE